MEFGVLGPLSVVDGESDRTPTAPKQRQLLALLLMNANRTVSMAQIVEELWECNPPPSATGAVQTYVKQLRRALHGRRIGSASRRLVTGKQGYLIRVQPGELDLDVFTERIRAARALLPSDTVTAVHGLGIALDLWRGQALVDVLPGPLLQQAISALEQARLSAIIDRIGGELHLGRHHELIGELSALVCHHPTNERLAAHLMLALYRSGRQADAIAAYHRLRRALRDEFGASPSASLQALNTDILSAHPRLQRSTELGPQLSLDLASS